MIRDATFWTAVAALAASASACLAALYTWLTYRLVRSQKEPNVIVYVRHDESRPSLLQIVIENIGRGLATDVSFKASRPIPARAWGISEAEAKPSEPMTEGPLVHGIPGLGPGDSRKLTWGQYGGLKNALGDEVIEIVCRYGDGRRRRQYSVVSKLDVRSFAATDAVPSDAARVTRELERIAKAVENLGTNRE